MREIKFRAWDKEKKCLITGQWIWYIGFDGRVWAHDKPTENIELIQYTGLKDKNGKEIYEGDILQQGNEIRDIEWRADTEPFAPNFRYYDLIDEWEVIGNIYENPELLN